MKALVVDDSRSMRSIVSRILSGVGVEEIEQAGDGQQAIQVLESSALPDIALVDWHMPVMNGLEFVTAVRQRREWRPMAIMMVTTESEQSQIVRALAAGAHEYLIKPFTPDALVEKLTLLGFSPRANQFEGVAG
jgi:two-component system chemotaxis response regulator CheY